MTLAGSPLPRELAEGELNGVHVRLWDPLGGSGEAAAARRREREALRRYQALIAAARESLYRAEAHFGAASRAVDEHIHAALAAVAKRRATGRPLAHQVSER